MLPQHPCICSSRAWKSRLFPPSNKQMWFTHIHSSTFCLDVTTSEKDSRISSYKNSWPPVLPRPSCIICHFSVPSVRLQAPFHRAWVWSLTTVRRPRVPFLTHGAVITNRWKKQPRPTGKPTAFQGRVAFYLDSTEPPCQGGPSEMKWLFGHYIWTSQKNQHWVM